MIDTYGLSSVGHVWLGLDPGVTTGVAILSDEGKVLGTAKLEAATLKDDLDEMIRRIHRGQHTIDVVQERLARVGSGELARILDQVLADITEVVVEVYDLDRHEVTPGEWKSSRVAIKFRKELDAKLSAHEKDAACMTAYVIAKGVKPTVRPRSFNPAGRPRLPDTPKRVAQRIRDEKRREKRRAQRANW